MRYKMVAPAGQMVRVIKSDKRFMVIAASRRIGKTLNALIWLGMGALSSENIRWKNWYIAPTYKEGRDIAWDLMKLLYKNIAIKENDSRLEITLKSGDKIAIKGADNIESLRGRPVNRFILDEFGTMKHPSDDYLGDGTPFGTLRPALSDTNGRGLIIGTPKGKNHFYKLFNDVRNGVRGDDWQEYLFKAVNSPFIPKEEIEQAQRDLTPAMFRQEYEASFETFKGQLFQQADLDLACGVGNSYGAFRGQLVRAWDLATTVKTYSDYTAGGLYGRELDKLHVLDMIRGKWEYPEAKQIIIQTAEQDGISVPIIIESVGGFKAVYQDIKRELRPRGFRVLEEKRTTGDKLTFAMPVLALSRTNKLIIHPFRNRSDVISEWLSLSQDCREWTHDDTLDTASMGHRFLFRHTQSTSAPSLGSTRGKKRF